MKVTALHARFVEEARKGYPNEVCGYVVSASKGLQVFPCVNAADNPREHFKIAPRSHLAAKQAGTIVGVYHSHPDGDTRLSPHDEAVMNTLRLPFHVVSFPAEDVRTHYPSQAVAPYVGRDYILGIRDCYTLVVDWAKKEHGVVLPHYTTSEKWWLKGEDRYSAHIAKHADKVSNFAECELVLFRIDSPVPNHMAIRWGEDRILHHLIGRTSSIDVWNRFWIERAVSYWRLKKL